MVTRTVIVGTSSRALGMYTKEAMAKYKDQAKLVGFCDVNRTRAAYFGSRVDPDVPLFADFDAMLAETRPDLVIVTTIDRYHADYVVRSLEFGCDVLTEKPMCIDADQVRKVLEAERRTGNKVIVTFNYRFTPYTTKIKQLLQDNAIGDILHVKFEYVLDRVHGAEYFRRWHRHKANSGGLLVHKSTHHFDLVNWWLDQRPVTVRADGNQQFYGKAGRWRGVRCSACEHSGHCEFAVKHHENPFLQAMYFQAEQEDGYVRDACVFDESIDIEDTMSVLVRYSRGTLLNYSLVTYSPYEGWKLTFTGTAGRMEAAEYHTGPHADKPYYELQLFRTNGDCETIAVTRDMGSHGGGDDRLLETIFGADTADPLGHRAGSRSGASSALVGICANRSIAGGQTVPIPGDLLS